MMTFYLKAISLPFGKTAIKEWFKFVSIEEVENAQGQKRPRILFEGYVDDDIKAENKKQYEAFAAKVEANKDKLYEAARQNVGKLISVEDIEK